MMELLLGIFVAATLILLSLYLGLEAWRIAKKTYSGWRRSSISRPRMTEISEQPSHVEPLHDVPTPSPPEAQDIGIVPPLGGRRIKRIYEPGED